MECHLGLVHQEAEALDTKKLNLKKILDLAEGIEISSYRVKQNRTEDLLVTRNEI